MAYNFSPLDFSQGINYYQNQWNNIGNAFNRAGQAFDSFATQKRQWDEMQEKKNKFQTGMNNIRSQVENDNRINERRNQLRGQIATAQENLNNKVDSQADSAMSDWSTGETSHPYAIEKNGKPTKQYSNANSLNIPEGVDSISDENMSVYHSLPELGDVDTSAEEEDLRRLQEEYDEAGLLSGYAKYLSDPMFEVALQQSEQEQSFEPLMNYINAFNADEYKRQRDDINDKLQERMLGAEEQAKASAANDAKNTYYLNNELSFLNGLNFGRNGKVKAGPYAGKTMEQLITPVIEKYAPIMGEEALYNALNQHRTYSDYMKMFANKGSTPAPRKKKRLF